MENVGVPEFEEECLEKCEGIIMEAEKTETIREEDVLAELLADYENYKFPDGSNLSFPQSMTMRGIQRKLINSLLVFTGLEFKSNLKFVRISISTSVYENISKVRRNIFYSDSSL